MAQVKNSYFEQLEAMEPHELSEDEREMYRTLAQVASDGAFQLSSEDAILAELEMTDLIISCTATGPVVN